MVLFINVVNFSYTGVVQDNEALITLDVNGFRFVDDKLVLHAYYEDIEIKSCRLSIEPQGNFGSIKVEPVLKLAGTTSLTI